MSHDSSGLLSTVLVASSSVLAAWSERSSVATDVVALDESDAQGIIDVVAKRKPKTVVLERRFLMTSKGAALVHRLRHDEDLPRVEIRVLPTEHAVALTTSHSPLVSSPAAVVSLAQPITGPVRRAVRTPMPDGVEVQVNGVVASIVDLSTLGAQVISPRALKPNESVRVQLADDRGRTVRTLAGVAWAAFELPPGAPPRYRVGMEFHGAEPGAIETFYERLASSPHSRQH
jgi:hypothetical protein